LTRRVPDLGEGSVGRGVGIDRGLDVWRTLVPVRVDLANFGGRRSFVSVSMREANVEIVF
jgi:hypothetical protein